MICLNTTLKLQELQQIKKVIELICAQQGFVKETFLFLICCYVLEQYKPAI